MKESTICVIGHPFAPSGVGQLARSVIDALLATGRDVHIVDCHGYYPHWPRYSKRMVDKPGPGTNIYCINGDEVEAILLKLGPLNSDARNIIFPAWELPQYPRDWATQLDRFEEIWSMSAFSTSSFRTSVTRPVKTVHIAVAPQINRHHSRKHFGLPDSAYLFFFTFDFTSYATRKNPFAVMAAFHQCIRERPRTDTLLLIKVGNSQHHPQAMQELKQAVSRFEGRVRLMDQRLCDDEMKSLLMTSDALVSLHRAEGFGLLLAEAMYFEKPVVATGYSGNMAFMDRETALLVDHQLVPVNEGEYPYHGGQTWAEPDVEQATRCMISLLDDRAAGQHLGKKAGRHIRHALAPLRVGRTYLAALDEKVPPLPLKEDQQAYALSL
ncbi:MAG TPA: glycosyltransferase family 4 protein [Kiritimatiellia bacterium]|nr:glycosyltransferase family 4 protein [Kiritimatiellia bacterium]